MNHIFEEKGFCEKQIPAVFQITVKWGSHDLKRSPLAIYLMVFKNLMVSTIGQDCLARVLSYPPVKMTGKLSVQKRKHYKNLHFCLEGASILESRD